MDHLDPIFVIAAYVFVGMAAICVGIGIARTLNPPNEAMIARGDCPACKARKSLRTTPINRSSAIMTCGQCVSQWLIENVDGDQIVFGPANQPVMPPLRMTQDDRTGWLMFETDVGVAYFDLSRIDFSHRRALLECSTPRHRLNFLFRSGIAPDRLDLAPKQTGLATMSETPFYQWFAASAGLDIYHLMPGWTPDLHGEEQ